jgi:hypothetical protein
MDDDRSDAGITTPADQPEGPPASPVADNIDPYWRSISLQAAARLARIADLAATHGAGWPGYASNSDEIERRSRRSWMVGLVVGATLYAGIMSFFIDMLRSPVASPTEISTTLLLVPAASGETAAASTLRR